MCAHVCMCVHVCSCVIVCMCMHECIVVCRNLYIVLCNAHINKLIIFHFFFPVTSPQIYMLDFEKV